MKSRTVVFQQDQCRMTLIIPAAIIEMSLTNLRKFFKWACRWAGDNKESVHEFFSCVPEVTEYLMGEWNTASIEFQKDYQDPDFDSKGNKIMDAKKKKSRKAHNNILLKKVKTAKANYDKFQKKIPKLKELQDQYDY